MTRTSLTHDLHRTSNDLQMTIVHYLPKLYETYTRHGLDMQINDLYDLHFSNAKVEISATMTLPHGKCLQLYYRQTNTLFQTYKIEFQLFSILKLKGLHT